MIREWLRQLRIDIEPYHLPQEVEEQCFRYLSSLGLQYGCIDMMVTPEDEYVFLEINPNGQWWFIEERAGLPVGKAIAGLLINGK